jgi:hypothetical protein
MTIGKWRIRARLHVKPKRDCWAKRQRYPEGDVYMVQVGTLFLKAMVDCMTPRERDEYEQLVRRWRPKLDAQKAGR